MANQENKDFSEDVADQGFQNGEAGGGGDAAENGAGSQDSQEDR